MVTLAKYLLGVVAALAVFALFHVDLALAQEAAAEAAAACAAACAAASDERPFAYPRSASARCTACSAPTHSLRRSSSDKSPTGA